MLALSIGCASGIGPEVSVRAAAEKNARDLLLIGDARVIARAMTVCAIDRAIAVIPRAALKSKESLARAASAFGKDTLLVHQPTESLDLDNAQFGAPSKKGGAAQLEWVRVACELARSKVACGMVTGPVSKEAVVRGGGKGFIGHTEYLAKLCGVPEVTMAFWTEPFTSALVTTHMALAAVPRAVTRARVRITLVHLARFLISISRRKREIQIAIVGVNPHAGEHGQFGNEESRVVIPAIADALKELARNKIAPAFLGPLPVEHAYRLAQSKKVDGVVAMYHDQATLAMKLLSFGEAVNVTLGLPIVRTSVDHGTAYDIAGKGVADARGMIEAIELARAMTR